MDWFLGILQITEEDFYSILETHQVYPWKFDRAAVEDGMPLPDMPQWFVPNCDEPVGPPRDEAGRINRYL